MIKITENATQQRLEKLIKLAIEEEEEDDCPHSTPHSNQSIGMGNFVFLHTWKRPFLSFQNYISGT